MTAFAVGDRVEIAYPGAVLYGVVAARLDTPGRCRSHPDSEAYAVELTTGRSGVYCAPQLALVRSVYYPECQLGCCS